MEPECETEEKADTERDVWTRIMMWAMSLAVIGPGLHLIYHPLATYMGWPCP